MAAWGPMFSGVTDGHEDISLSLEDDQDDDHDEGFSLWLLDFYRLMGDRMNDPLMLQRLEAALINLGYPTGDDVLADLPGLLNGTHGPANRKAS